MKTYDWSNGSSNPYTVEPRHNLITKCLECGEDTTVTLDGSDYFRYFMCGVFVQDVFPYLNDEQRDCLSVGIHPECSGAFYGRMEEIVREDNS